MESTAPNGRNASAAYTFGPFRLIPRERRLLRNDRPVPLTPKALDTLLVLVEKKGRLIETAELIERVWRGLIVEEAGLTRNISSLRKALGESGRGPRYIETVRGYGYRFVAAVKVARDSPPRIESTSRIRSLAILPLKTITTDKNQDFLGLGLADALITKLCGLKQIAVLPTSAISGYVQADQDSVSAGRTLKCDSVLEGMVQQSGDRIRVTVQLIRISDGSPLWADKFEGQFADIFAVQDSISGQIAATLVSHLTNSEKKQLSRHYTESTKAYRHYAKGRHFFNKRTGKWLKNAIEQFQQAIDEDPDYALAYVGLAESYTVLSFYTNVNPKEAFPKAKAAALSALQIDKKLGEAIAILGSVHLVYDWDWAAAEEEFVRALDLSPNYANAWHWYGWYLLAMGQFEGAEEKFKRAQELDPLSRIIPTTLGEMYYYLRHYDRSVEQLQKVLQVEPDFAVAHLDMGRNYLQKGDFSGAIAEIDRARAISGATADNLGMLGYAYAVSGQKQRAQKLLREIKAVEKRQYFSPYYIALIHVGLGETDLAFEWFNRAWQSRSEKRLTIQFDPMLDGIRSDPRFIAWVRAMGSADILPASVRSDSRESLAV